MKFEFHHWKGVEIPDRETSNAAEQYEHCDCQEYMGKLRGYVDGYVVNLRVKLQFVAAYGCKSDTEAPH